MLDPSIDTLQKKVESKYTIVTIAARRARELRVEQNFAIKEPKSATYVGMALEEIADGKLKIVDEE